MKNILVTGGAGFIGSHIVQKLILQGFTVSVMDNLLTGNMENLSDVIDSVSEFYMEDIRSIDACIAATKGMDAILHQAALPSVPRSIKDPILTNDININGTLNMLMAAKNNKISKFVFASSSSVYGDTEIMPKKENIQPSPKSPYALQKLVGEYYVKLFSALYGMETISLRYFNVFGPRQDPNSQYSAVIPLFVNNMLNNKSLDVFGDGEQSRDFTYVDNVADANILCLSASNLTGQAVNVACGNRYTLNYLIKQLEIMCKKKADYSNMPPREGDVKHSQADIKMASELIGFRPSVDFDEGLKRTVESFIP